MPKEKDIHYMGYSVRWKDDNHEDAVEADLDNWRCTIWMGWNMKSTPRYNMSDIVGMELYNHNTDSEENYNLAEEKMFISVLKKCFQFIENYVK